MRCDDVICGNTGKDVPAEASGAVIVSHLCLSGGRGEHAEGLLSVGLTYTTRRCQLPSSQCPLGARTSGHRTPADTTVVRKCGTVTEPRKPTLMPSW